MKIIKPRHDLFLKAYFPIVFSGLAALLLFPKQLWAGLSISWLWLFIAIGIALSPKGKQYIGGLETTPVYRRTAWLLRLFALQISSLIIFAGLLISIIHNVPNLIKPYPATIPMIEQGFKLSLWQWGLFPWPLCALIALGCRRQPQLLAHIFAPLYQRYPSHNAKLIFNYCFKQALQIGMVTTLAFFCVHLSHILGSLLGITIAVGWRFKTLIISSMLFLPSALKGRKPTDLRSIQAWKIYQLAIVICLIVCAFILTANYALHLLQFYYPPLPTHPPLPTWAWLYTVDWRFYLWTWWLCWTFFTASYVQKISVGYSFRALAGALLSLPLLISLSLFQPLGFWTWLINIVPVLEIILPCLGLILFIFYLRLIKAENLFLTDAKKQHPEILQRAFFQATLVLSAIYIVVGSSIPAAFSFVMVIPCGCFLLLATKGYY